MVTILLADDEAIERQYFKKILENNNDYQVIGEARNGQEITKLALQLKPDIVIMDINMPLINGLEAAKIIKEKLPTTIIILNTAYADFEFAKKALDYHLDAYILKPASAQQVFATLSSCYSHCNKISSPPENIIIEPSYQTAKTIDILVEYIDANYKQNLTLEDLSQLVHFSPSHISKLFHREQGVTVTTYITRKKIDNAKYMLKHTNNSIQEIANYSGFSNISHFNRVFKTYTGIPPVQYRLT